LGAAALGSGTILAGQGARDQSATGRAAAPATSPATPQTPAGPDRAGAPSDGRGGRGGPGNDYKFWKDPAVVKEMALTPDQVARIDRIYEDRARRVAPVAEDLDKQRAELERLIGERTADWPVVELQAAKVTALFAKISESRIVMAYRIDMVLNAEQHKKMKAISERQRATGDHGRGGRGTFPSGIS
jgi:Spy/CpxP family protein refolding chaperone